MSKINRDQIYILNDPDEAREALLKTASMYMDFYEYGSAISELEAQFDESIEIYDTPMWITIGETQNAPSTVAHTYGMLRHTVSSFNRIVREARTSCEGILLQILSFPSEKIERSLGFPLVVSPKKRKRFIAFFFEYLEENGIEFDPNDLYSKDVECRDPVQAMVVKSHRFLCVLEQVKDMEIPSKEVSRRASSKDENSLGKNYEKNLIESMKKFTETRKRQFHCICDACHSDFWADTSDIECGMVKCPGCGSTEHSVLQKKEPPTQEEIDNSYEQAASKYMVGDKMICFCPICNKDCQIPMEEVEADTGKCPKCGGQIVRYI